MKKEEKLKKKLDRLSQLTERVSKIFDQTLKGAEEDYFLILKEWEEEQKGASESYQSEKETVQGTLDQLKKEYTRKKYVLEKENAGTKGDIKKLTDDLKKNQDFYQDELLRLKEKKEKVTASFERQKDALRDLYQEKRQHLIRTKAKMVRQWQAAEENLKKNKSEHHEKLTRLQKQNEHAIKQIKEEMTAKSEGWDLAAEAMRKEIASLNDEKEDLVKKSKSLRTESEKELEASRLALSITQEQLEVDKATLVEKAEVEKNQLDSEVESLQKKIENINLEIQDLTVQNQNRTKVETEAFEKEETALRDVVRLESEKRDYEQKLYEQEKKQKEKELARAKEDYDRKKWQWDNHLRNMMMQRSVQEAEHNAERMRTNREARVALKGLEAKRDELKQTLSGLKSRYNRLKEHEQKETEIRNQRFQWRKDRLWTLWQNRLTQLKKERGALHEQLEALEKSFKADRDQQRLALSGEQTKIDDIQQHVLRLSEQNSGQRRQNEIQKELEKTRLMAQIKECETLITDWRGRLKSAQEEVDQQNLSLSEQFRFLERFYKEEEQETELFLHDLKSVLSSLETQLGKLIGSEKAA